MIRRAQLLDGLHLGLILVFSLALKGLHKPNAVANESTYNQIVADKFNEAMHPKTPRDPLEEHCHAMRIVIVPNRCGGQHISYRTARNVAVTIVKTILHMAGYGRET